MFGPKHDEFEEWLRVPLPELPIDSRYEVRRARPADFDAIYALVDDVFGVARSRAAYDWIYRENPSGIARCWIVIEKASGKLVSSGANFPWPAACGETRMIGLSGGDSVVARHLQRQGIDRMRLDVRRTHPWRHRSIIFGWPNEKSVSEARGQGLAKALVSPLPHVVLNLRSRARRRWARPLANAAGAAVDAWAATRRGMARGAPAALRIEVVSRFDADFDAVSHDCMGWEGFWFPRDSEFLNWRYLRHPTQEYRALAALRDDRLEGYCVLNLAGRSATLMEFAVPTARADVSAKLLHAAARSARAASCDRVEFFTTPGWRCWNALHAAGFAECPSQKMLFLLHGGAPVSRADEWVLVPGDHDAL